MFKKIRNKILLLNMVMVSSVVIAAFAVIFATTYTRTRSDNQEKLMYDLPVRQRVFSAEFFGQEGSVSAQSGVTGPVAVTYATRISPDAGMSFSLLVDSQINVIEINSMIDLQPETYDKLAAQALEAADSKDTTTLDGRTWQYMVFSISATFLDTSGGGVTAVTSPTELSHIRFLDVTDSYRMIRSLALLLSVTTIVILAVFFFISRYFAGQAIRPMKEAWEKQSRFIADASHELKTPLSVINANCGVLYSGKEETVESQLKWVDSITRSADRMAGLVGSLLSLANMEDAQLTPQSLLFDLSETVAEAAGEVEAAALEKRLTVRREIEQGVEIKSDREHVRKILSILLDNAVKYTGAGGEVTVSLIREKRHVICAVRNSGDGIPPEDLPHLFDRFYRRDPARSSENNGYGLGLSIAWAIANQLDVRLSAESVLGEYTEFKLIFEANR